MSIPLEQILYKEVVSDWSPQPLLDGDGDSLANDVVLDLVVNELVISVSEQQYIEMLGALINGAIITYPQSWIEVLYPLIKAAKVANTLCAKVEACIDETPSIQQLITEVSVSNYTYPNTIPMDTAEMDNRFIPSDRAETISDDPTGCNLDLLWAGIFEMVFRLDAMNLDVLQTIVAEADKAERIARAVALIPFFGDLAGEVVLAIAEESQNLLNAYEAYVTTAVLEEIACDFFDAHCEDCEYPTFDEVLDHYSSFSITGASDWVNIGYTAMIDLLIGSSGLANMVVFFTVSTATLYTLFLGGAVLGRRGAKWLGIWCLLGEDAPSSDWEILCDACEPPYCYNFDFLTSDGGWVWIIGRPFGIWATAVGWQSVWGSVSGFDERLYIRKVCTIETSITEVSITLEVTGTLGTSPDLAILIVDGVLPNFTLEKQYALGVQTIIYPVDNGLLHSQEIRVVATAGSAAEGNIDIVITAIKVRGEGDNPFDVPDNC